MSAIRESFATFRRAPLLSSLSVITIAFSLFAFGLFALVAINTKDTLESIEERVEIRAFIVNGTSDEAALSAEATIREYPEVLEVVYVDKERALEKAREDLGEFADLFEPGVLPASLDISLNPGFRTPSHVEEVVDRLQSFTFLEDIRYGQEWIQKLYRLRVIATIVGAGLGLAFALVSIMIIGSTIRMVVLARKEEIAIMRVVGATDGFIRMPFLLEGFFQGVLGGLLALGLTYLTSMAVQEMLFDIVFFDWRMAAAGVLSGALIGLMGSAFAVGRHLKKV